MTYEIEDETNKAYALLKMTNAVSFCTVTEAFDAYSVGDKIDGSDFINLSDTNKNKCISEYINISFDPNILLVDNTSSILNYATYTTTNIGGVDYINTMRFKIDPSSTLALKFYKINNSNNYTYPIVNNTSAITVNIQDP